MSMVTIVTCFFPKYFQDDGLNKCIADLKQLSAA